MQLKGASTISGVSSGASTVDLLREAPLQPLEATAAIRSIEYYRRSKTRGEIVGEDAKLQFKEDEAVHENLDLLRVCPLSETIDTYGERLRPKPLKYVARPYSITTPSGNLSAQEATEEQERLL